jgi:nitrite reductase (NADH) small subunit
MMTNHNAEKQSPPRRKTNKQFSVCKTTELPPGERRIIQVDGKTIGVFNVKGHYYALLNYCPHTGGALCLGPVTGTTLPSTTYEFKYGQEEAILRCAWHGWEFEIETGQALVDPKIKAKTYEVAVENDDVVIYI